MKRVLVSYDHENNRHQGDAVRSWPTNGKVEFNFSQAATDTNDVATRKEHLLREISRSDCLFIILGKEADSEDPAHNAIGHRNWLNFAIARSKDLKKKIIGYKISAAGPVPLELHNARPVWITSLNRDSFLEALG